MARLVLSGMRPKQWLKNTFVLAGLVFSGQAFDPGCEARAWAATLAFCLISGAGYLVNDVADLATDRLNPRTACRPVARGDLPPRVALAGAVVGAIGGLALATAVNWQTAATTAAFLGLQLTYSLFLKRALFVDVLAIATGFVLRGFAGLVAIDVEWSEWLLLVTGLLALFLALGKRRGELLAQGEQATSVRSVLGHYTVELVDDLISMTAPAIVVVYALYAVLGAPSDAMMLTVPLVIFGVFRLLLIIRNAPDLAEEPSMMIWRDRPLLTCGALWVASAGTIALVVT